MVVQTTHVLSVRTGCNRKIEFMKYLNLFLLFSLVTASNLFAGSARWKKGIVTDEFIFTTAPYPSCHAATITETPEGLVAAWFGGTRERHPDVGIWVSLYRNGKWIEAKEVANGVINDTLRYPTWNPVLYQIPNGKLMLFFKRGPSPSTWQGMLTESADHGMTWSKPQPLPEGFIGPVKNKPVLLPSGELFCPSSTEGSGWKVHFEVTSDFGKSWKKIGPVDENTINAIQPSLLWYADGRLQILCRSRSRAIAESWSADGGKTWSPLTLTSLPNNNSGTDAVTLKDDRQLLVYNHVLPPGQEAKGPRTPLNVSISKDGKHWFAALVLEDSPVSQYSYPSVIQTSDGMVHVVYTWRRERIKHVVIDPSMLKLKKIKDMQWPDKKLTKKMSGTQKNEDTE
jgi:predicted neuraminidase